MRKRNGEGASGRAVQKQIINQDKAKTRQKRFAWISYYYYLHYDTITKPYCMFYHRRQRQRDRHHKNMSTQSSDDFYVSHLHNLPFVLDIARTIFYRTARSSPN